MGFFWTIAALRNTRLSATTVVVAFGLMCSGSVYAELIYWNASSGVAPWDSALPPSQRWSGGGPGMTYVPGQFVNLNDLGSGGLGMAKGDTFTVVAPGAAWAYQTEVRVNSHSRDLLDWGVEGGVDLGPQGLRLAIARDRVGFQGNDGNSWLNGISVPLDETDNFRTYRVTHSEGIVSLYVDTFDAPVITFALAGSSGQAYVIGASTSSGGAANLDVRGFGFNPSGTFIPAPTSGVLLTTPTVVGPTDLTIAGVPLGSADITVRGTTLTINGRHTIAGLRLERGATNQPGILTHDTGFSHDYGSGGSDVVFGLDLLVNGNVSIQAASGALVRSSVDVSRKGYAPLQGPGAGAVVVVGGFVSYRIGGGFGGRGGNAGPTGGASYGSAAAPVQFGSGGANDGSGGGVGSGGRGGGSVKLAVLGTATIGGQIRADGGSVSVTECGCSATGGAGGSIWLIAQSVIGSGVVSSNGGTAATSCGGGPAGGGGGRVSITGCGSSSFLDRVTVTGGIACASGETGTVVIQDASSALAATEQPTVCRGGTASMSVITGGSGNFGYAWHKDGEALVNGLTASGAVVLGASAEVLHIANCQREDGGQYLCVVTGPCGPVSTNTVDLFVCEADFDCSDTVAVPDIFAFLSAWFIGDSRADIDGSGGLSVPDIFALLSAWFAGCP